MTIFPNNASEIRVFADALVKFLLTDLQHQRGEPRPTWTEKNLKSLERFSKSQGARTFSKLEGGEYLWDFIAYVNEYGLLIAAESEWDDHQERLEEDFDKLLYAKALVKVFICRGEEKKTINTIYDFLSKYLQDSCKQFSPSEVFILYFTWWPDEAGDTQDIAYLLQVPGEPSSIKVDSVSFDKVGA